MIGNVHLREPNTLIVAKQVNYNFVTKSKSLINILYRTSLQGKQIVGPNVVQAHERGKTRIITSLTAWGKAYKATQTEPQVYELSRASFSTCPPINPAWRIKGSHIELDKNSGRGYATNARILVKNIPIFYTPYINFPLDSRRKTGFLWPTYGGSSNSGFSLYLPFYWDLAPNYDTTITPAVLLRRGVQLSDKFRYLTPTSTGSFDISFLPRDQLFSSFQNGAKGTTPIINGQSPQVTNAEINRLLNASTTRRSFAWRDKSRFNDHWSSNIDFNYAGDDYYMRDLGNINQLTQNQLLQEGDLFYKSENWNFTGRLQAYQTLHPYDEQQVLNQYRRLPQLILNGDYPDQWGGFEYFIYTEATHFNILNTPGTVANQPIGNRLHAQPGISLPMSNTYFYLNPRVQLALTDYNLYQTSQTATPTDIHRGVPIFDIASGLTFNRDLRLFGNAYQQTLEPQIYYTYIPYRNQSSIPTFDTNVSTLSYDQVFSYNRFTGIDRIGDANQIGIGAASRFIDQETGLEKIRVGLGAITYFAHRKVTFCNNSSCSDNPGNSSNRQGLSPLSGLFDYHINPSWRFGSNALWNPISKKLDIATVGFNYAPDVNHLLNLGYTYASNGDVSAGLSTPGSQNSLKVTDFSFAWPVPLTHDFSAVGRWSQSWNRSKNQQHLQNLLYGLQYDTCCWAVQLVGGKAFTNLNAAKNNKPEFKKQFYIQFALKGLGNVGAGNESATSLLGTITGYNSHFGQDL
jgi:LPS-assembly protein